MNDKITRVAILGRQEDPHVAELMTVLVAHLTKAGISVFGSDDLLLELDVQRLPEQQLTLT